MSEMTILWLAFHDFKFPNCGSDCVFDKCFRNCFRIMDGAYTRACECSSFFFSWFIIMDVLSNTFK